MFNKLKFTLTHLHLQAKTYIALIVVAIFLNMNFMSWERIFGTIVFALLWTLLIEYAGKKGYRSGAWILVILPFTYMYFSKSIQMNHMISKMMMGPSTSTTTSKGTTQK